jgi:hypothetical protein
MCELLHIVEWNRNFEHILDLTGAVTETRPGDASTTFPGRSSEFGTDDIEKKVGPLSQRAGRKALGQTLSGRLDGLDHKVIECHGLFG